MHRVLIVVHDNYEDLELWYPKIRLEEAGCKLTLAGPEPSMIYKGKHGYPCLAQNSFDQIDSDHFSAIVIPGGFAPDKLRRNKKVLSLVQEFYKADKCVAFICHGGWVPISAKILSGKKATGSPAIKDDLENAGAIWEDSPVVVDGPLISSRRPDDLPHFTKAIIERLLK